jgi:hypothetical protein
VVKGYVQKQGIDFEEVFMLVAHMESVRLILAIAAHEGWRVHHMDVKSAFLNGELEEDMYIQQSPGFVAGQDHQVLKLKKAMYGLRQAPIAWYSKLHTSLYSLGFVHSDHEHAVYTRHTMSRPLVIGVYVDDLPITMQKQFWMSDLGLLTYYLGIEVCHDNSGIAFCQNAYARKHLDRTSMVSCNPSSTPMEARLQLVKKSSEGLVNATKYWSVVGALRYLVHTRSDLAHSVSIDSRFMSEPHEDHLAVVKRILCYVAGTQEHGVCYARGRAEDLMLLGFSDSDHAGDVEDNQSTSGILLYLGQSPILGQSQKQKSMALSSCVAEYMASSAATYQAIWLARLLTELLGIAMKTPLLKMNNKAAIHLIKNPVHHGRSNHIQICYHFIRECASEGRIEV